MRIHLLAYAMTASAVRAGAFATGAGPPASNKQMSEGRNPYHTLC